LITVNYNSADKLRAHWGQELPADVEWIVVDNASADGSAETAEELGATSVIRLPENIGFGAANNLGYTQARGEHIAFVNPDLTIDLTSLQMLEASLAREPGVIGPQLIYPDGDPQPSGRGLPSLANKVLSRLGRARTVRQYYIYAEPGEERYVGWLVGAAVVATRATFDRLGEEGPWDRRFFVYYEDSDIGLRAWRLGIPVRVVGDARWTHGWARDTSGGFRWRAWVIEFRGAWAFYTRYPALVFGVGRRSWWARLRDTRWGTRVAT
jgi:N-acetylglucosaminyl-diphospho-decaprenol L-rhamnosyltransferase